MSKYVGLAMKQRGKELKEVREQAFELWKRSHSHFHISAMLGVNSHTTRAWVSRWNHGKGLAGKIKQAVPIVKLPPLEKPTWEQIVKACPNTETLGLILVNGFLAIAQERDNLRSNLLPGLKEANETIAELGKKVSELTQERDRILKLHNEQVARKRVGHLTIDQIKHRLIPKE